MATGLKKLLAVSWAMPPMLFPRSIQVSRVLSALQKRGWQVTAICGDPRSSENLDPSLAELYSGCYKTIHVPASRSLDDALMSGWLKPALKEVKKQLATGGYSALVTFAQPWVDHLIGLEGQPANIPWIAHFSDPWVDSPYYAGFSKEQLNRWRKMERAVIRRADTLLFTNSQAAELVMKKYPHPWMAKTKVIPHAFDAETATVACSEIEKDGRLRMIYTGDLYKGRSAEGFMKALNLLATTRPLAQEFQVQIIGRIAEEERKLADVLKLQGIVHFGDQLPYLESLKKMAQCDVLLLIDAPTTIPGPFLPSKLVDYLAFRKPILGLTNIGGASADLLMKLGSPIVPPDDVSAIASALEALLDAWQQEPLKLPPNYEEVVAGYTLQHVGALFDQTLQEAIASHTPRPWWQIWS